MTVDPVFLLCFNMLLICYSPKSHSPFPQEVYKLAMQIPSFGDHFPEISYRTPG